MTRPFIFQAINVLISPSIVKTTSATALLEILQANNIKYEVDTQAHDDMITIWRETTRLDANVRLIYMNPLNMYRVYMLHVECILSEKDFHVHVEIELQSE